MSAPVATTIRIQTIRSKRQVWCRATAMDGPSEGLSFRVEVFSGGVQRDERGYLVASEQLIRATEAGLLRLIAEAEEESP